MTKKTSDPLLLPPDETASDTECDEVLRVIYKANRTQHYVNVAAIQHDLNLIQVNYTVDKIIAATSILYYEGFIKPRSATRGSLAATVWGNYMEGGRFY